VDRLKSNYKRLFIIV